MRSLAVPLVVLVMVLAACDGSDGSTADTHRDGTDRLVVLDPDGAIVTMTRQGTDVTTLAEPLEGEVFFQPQFSPITDRVAWGRLGTTGASVTIVEADGSGEVSAATANLPFYLFWAPDGERLVALYNGARGRVEASHIVASTGMATALGAATPYYFSWEPTSARIVANRNGSTLDLIEQDGTVTTVGEGSAAYLAPAWTAAGIYHLVGTSVVRSDTAGASEPIAEVPGVAWLVPSADGRYLAIQPFPTGSDPGTLTVGLDPVPRPGLHSVTVVDTETGEVSLVADEPSAGFFWSSDGSALAVLVLGETRGDLQWLVWRDGETTRYASFTPTGDFVRSVLEFAPQYALSLRLWSPDSTAFAFVGRIDGFDGVWVQDLAADAPRRVTDGSWVAWSHG